MASVVVVGGGVAGLACAWRLRRAGHEVEVLEREAEPGGRLRTDARGGFRLERGAQFVARGYRNARDLAAALGLVARDLEPAREAVYWGGRLHAAPVGASWRLLADDLLSARGKAGLARLAFELTRRRRSLDPWRPERAAALERERLDDGLRRLVGDEAAERLLLPTLAATFDCEPERLSLAFGLLALKSALGDFRLQYFEGGNAALTRALAAAVPVRRGCEAVSVETETAGARVRYRTQGRERSVLADAAVVAVPGPAVPALCPKLSPEERGFFQSVAYGRGILVHLLLEDPPPALRQLSGVSFPAAAGVGLYGLCADHHKRGYAPPGAGLVNAALTERAVGRLWDAPDGAVVRHALEALAGTPVGRLSPVHSVVHRHALLLPLFGRGALARLARFGDRIDRSPRLAFAGDYRVGPWVEGAVTSGLRAADEIAAQL